MNRKNRQLNESEPPPHWQTSRQAARWQHDADYLTALAAFFVLALEEWRIYGVDYYGPPPTGDLWEEETVEPMEEWRHWRDWDEKKDGSLAPFMEQDIWSDLRIRFKPTDGPLGLLTKLVEWKSLSWSAVETAYVAADQIRRSLEPLSMDEARRFYVEKIHNYGSAYVWNGSGFQIPTSLRAMVFSLVKLQPGSKLYDPNFDSNGWLVALAQEFPNCSWGNIRQIGISHIEQYRPRGERLHQLENCSFYGIQEHPHELLMGLLQLLLGGIQQPNLRLGNALVDMQPGEQFDQIFALPPMGRKYDKSVQSQFAIGAQSSESLYLEHILNSLKHDGCAFVVVPRGLLFRQGREQKLREHLLKNFRVEAVIQLPAGILKPTTNIPVALLIIRRAPCAENIWFITEQQFERMIEDQIGLAEEDQIDFRLLSTVLRAKLHGKSLEYELKRELDELARRISVSEKSDEEASSVEVVETRQQLLNFGRFLMERGAGSQPDREGQEFPFLVPVSKLLRRNAELIWKESGEDSLQELLEQIQKAVPGVKIAHLSDVASGYAYRGEDMVEEQTLSPEVRFISPRLVRVGDILKSGQDPQNRLRITSAMRFLRQESLAKIPKHTLIVAGDILISTIGTVGKVAVVGPTESPLVAASGVCIIRVNDPILNQYLPALLQTEPYQKWFQGTSSGSTVRHLTVRELRATPVPLFRGGLAPTVMNFLTPGQRAESILELLESKPKISPWINFVLDEPVIREFADDFKNTANPEQKLEMLKQIVLGIGGIQGVHSADPAVEPLVNWLSEFKNLSGQLLDIAELPQGQDRFVALQSWRLGFSSLKDPFKRAYQSMRNRVAHLSNDESDSGSIRLVCSRMEKLYNTLMNLWAMDCHNHLANIKISAGIAPNLIEVGRPAEITLAVQNSSLLPLKQFQMRTVPFESSGATPFLPVGGKHSCVLKTTPNESGKYALSLNWSAQRLDNSSVSGEIQLAFEVQDFNAINPPAQDGIGENPYIYGRVLEGDYDRMFYGREKDMAIVAGQLRRSGPTTIMLLEGNRRIGKTSLVKHFIRHGLPTNWLPVYINFQDFNGHQPVAGEKTLPGIPTKNVFLGMSRELVGAAREALPEFELPDLGAVPPKSSLLFRKFLDKQLTAWFDDDQPFTRFRSLLEHVREAIHPRRLLLILDEFDRVQEGIDSGITSDQVPENIRHVFQTYGDLGGIFTGSRTIRRLRQEYWNVLFGLGETHQLRGLDEQAAIDLVEKPVAGRLIYSPAASARIVELCARQPLLIQSICSRVFEVCKDSGERAITVEMVDNVAEDKAEDNEHFETLWAHIRTNRQRCLVFIVDELAEQNPTVAYSTMFDAAERHGIHYRGAKDFEADLEDLLDLEVLGATGERRSKTYRIEVPLFSMWLKRTKDFDQYRRETIEEQL